MFSWCVLKVMIFACIVIGFDYKFYLRFCGVDGPAQYQEGYNKLRSWAYSSLDQYQHELVRVLYQVFMDLVAKGHISEAKVFLTSFRGDHETIHARDLQKLKGVLSPSHLEEMEFARVLRQSKVSRKICQLRNLLLEKNGVSNVHSEKADGELREGELEESKKKFFDWGKQATTLKKLKKDKVGSVTTKASRSESTAVSGAPHVQPSALPVIPPEVEHSILDDSRNRVQLSGGALPSISIGSWWILRLVIKGLGHGKAWATK